MDTLVILTPGFPKDEEDTSCLPAFQQFALSLKKLYPNIRFIFIALHYPYEKKEYTWHGIKVISLGGKNKTGLSNLVLLTKTYILLRSIKRGQNLIGIFSLWLTECAFIGRYYSSLYKVKHYIWVIGQDAKANNKYVKRTGAKGSEIIAMSDFLKLEFFKNHHIDPFMVAENGINESAFPSFNKLERKIDILGAGSLIPLKNYNLFIDIVFELSKMIPDIRCVIIGTGPMENELNEKVKRLGLENRVEFTGLLQHAGVFDYMNNSKIFMHTSHYEGNSTVLMEALYSGCYTISSQPLSNALTENLSLVKTKEAFVRLAAERLNDKFFEPKRIIFNTMDVSAKKIMDLYLGPKPN